MIQFSDILIAAPLPLHKCLSDHPCLSVKVIVDGKICGETTAVKGDPKTGLWDLPSSLHVPKVGHSITFALLSNRELIKIRFASVTFSVSELLARVRRESFGYHEFIIAEPCSSILLLVSCSVRLAQSSIVEAFTSQGVARGVRADPSTTFTRKNHGGAVRLELEGADSAPLSRESLESLYAIICMQKRDDRTHGLIQLGSAYNTLYDKSSRKADLERAISLHKEATQIISCFPLELAGRSDCLGIGVQDRFSQSGGTVDIARVTRRHQKALPVPDESRLQRLKSSGNEYLHRFQSLGQPSDIDSAISCQRQAVELVPDGHPEEPNLLHNLGAMLLVRFQRLGSLIDMDSAILCQQKAVELLPDGHPEERNLLNNLGAMLRARFRRLGTLADMDDAISCQQKAVDLTPNGHPGASSLLNNLGAMLHTRFERLGSLADIENGVTFLERAVEATPYNHRDKSGCLNNLGNALQTRFQRFGNLADIEGAISSLQKAVELVPDSQPDKPTLLDNLGRALVARFGRLGTLTDIDSAISIMQRAVELVPDGHPDKPRRLSNLGSALSTRFGRLGSLADINSAISWQRKAVELTPDGHPDKPGRLSSLGSALRRRFRRLDSIVDMDNAISLHESAVEGTPDNHPDKPSRSYNLGNALQMRFQRLGRLGDIESAISSLQKAVEFTPDGHPDKPSRLSSLGVALWSRFNRLGSPTDIDNAILCQEKALSLIPDGYPGEITQRSNLAAMLQARSKRLGSLTDIEERISLLKKAVEATPENHPDMPGRVCNLGTALGERFEQLGRLADIDSAVSLQEKAVDLIPDDHPDKSRLFSNLGSALGKRFERLGRLADIDNAVSLQQKAVELTPDGHPDKPNRLSGLANALQRRFKRLDSLTDIDSAISCQQMAVELVPDGHPDKQYRLSDLGVSRHMRFQRLGSLADIDGAISCQQKVLSLVPDGDQGKPNLLDNLGAMLQTRFRRLGSLEDIENGITLHAKAVEITPDKHPGKPGRLSNLGSVLLTRFERLGKLEDIDNAMSSFQRAVELIPDSHPDRSSLLNNLGNALQTRFSRLGSLKDVENGISLQEEAVELQPDGHPDKPDLLCNLGDSLIRRYAHLHALEDLERGLWSYSIAANSPTGPAMRRFIAARKWAQVANKYSRSPLSAYRCAIDLLPRVAWLGLAVADQHALLVDSGDVVRDAVAAAVQLEDYETAVEWAEQGRSIVWQNMIGLRTPVDGLQATHPHLADRLRNITRQLDTSSPGLVTDAIPVAGVAHKYSELATEWEDIVKEIRQLPDFEGFLRRKSFAKLAPAAQDGAVVILNVGSFRCDALILIPHNSDGSNVSVDNIPLDRFSYEKGKKLFQELTRLLSSAGVRDRNARKSERVVSPTSGNSKFGAILRILWLDVVKPVIEGLAYQVQSGNLPRIWWCATGFLSFLPIHAAGLYGEGVIGEKISDYVVSSYTPTLTTILDLANPPMREDFQLLTVAQPSTPYAMPIPKTEEEVEVIRRLAKGMRVVNLKNEDAKVERVQQEMAKSDWIHLACHGQQRVDDPMKSGFLLHDRILQLSEIVKGTLPKADFAFLSACQTAMGDEKVAEESAHLAAGMLLSGCRGIIATMWSIRDEDGPRVAEEVYKRILKDGRPNRKAAAYALHEAVKRLRESGADFMAWVPFIHIGR